MSAEARPVLITGGAGFVGANVAHRDPRHGGERVVLFDNLARPGVARNVEWLRRLHGGASSSASPTSATRPPSPPRWRRRRTSSTSPRRWR